MTKFGENVSSGGVSSLCSVVGESDESDGGGLLDDQASAHFFGKGGAAAPPLKNQGGAISNQGGAKNFLHLFTPKFFRRCRQNFNKNCTFWT